MRVKKVHAVLQLDFIWQANPQSFRNFLTNKYRKDKLKEGKDPVLIPSDDKEMIAKFSNDMDIYYTQAIGLMLCNMIQFSPNYFIEQRTKKVLEYKMDDVFAEEK